jgi:hypothetical protein
LSDELRELERLWKRERNYQQARARHLEKNPPPAREQAWQRGMQLVAEARGLWESDDVEHVRLAAGKYWQAYQLLAPAAGRALWLNSSVKRTHASD